MSSDQRPASLSPAELQDHDPDPTIAYPSLVRVIVGDGEARSMARDHGGNDHGAAEPTRRTTLASGGEAAGLLAFAGARSHPQRMVQS
jgi:hypothetical protein